MLKNITQLLCTIISAVILTACNLNTPSINTVNSDYDLAAEKEAVFQAQENLFEILRNKQPHQLNDHYLPEVTRFHQEGGLDVGWSADRADEFQKIFDSGLTLTLTDWELLDLRIYGNTAITAGQAIGGWQDGDGNGTLSTIRFTYVWVKTAEGWKEAHHHASDFKGELKF